MENPNGILHFLMFVGTRKAGPGNAGVIKCPVDKWGPTKTNSLCGKRRSKACGWMFSAGERNIATFAPTKAVGESIGFKNTVEDCGLKPILFHYRAIPIRVSLFSYIRRDPKILLQKSITPYIM